MLDYVLYIMYNTAMARMGRPPTGHKPVVAVRMEPSALHRAKKQARATGKTLGVWLEEAIEEKVEREVLSG